MSQFFVTGPAYTWANIKVPTPGGSGSLTWNFIGFSEAGLTIEFTPTYEDIQVDYAGSMPGDATLLGQEARISGTFTRYNEPVVNQLASFNSGSNFASIVGTFGNNQVGGLVNLEGIGYPLMTYFPYSTKDVFGASFSQQPYMIPGYYFYSAYIVDPVRAVYSIRRKAPELAWRVIPQFGTFSSGNFQLNAAPFNASQIAAVLFQGSPPPGGFSAPNDLPSVN